MMILKFQLINLRLLSQYLSLYTPKISPRSSMKTNPPHSTSLPIASSIIPHLLNKFQQYSSFHTFVNNNLNNYSSNQMFTFINEIKDQVIKQPRQVEKEMKESQPKRFKKDAYMSVNKVDERGYYSKKKSDHMNKIFSMRIISNRNDKSTKNSHPQPKIQSTISLHSPKPLPHPKQQSIQLPNLTSQHQPQKIPIQKPPLNSLYKLTSSTESIQQDTHDIQINKMRKDKQEYQQELKQQEYLLFCQNQYIKNRKCRKFKMNFDYDGKLMDIVSENKTNLISQTVHSKIRQQSQINPENPDNTIKDTTTITPTYIKTQSIHDRQQPPSNPNNSQNPNPNPNQNQKNHPQKKSLEQHQQQQPIQFSGVTDPFTNIEVIRGVKAIFQNYTVENRSNKQQDEGEQYLSQTIHKRNKMSRSEYRKLKTHTNFLHSHNTNHQTSIIQNYQSIISTITNNKHPLNNHQQDNHYNKKSTLAKIMFAGNTCQKLESQQLGKKIIGINNCQSEHNSRTQSVKKSHCSRPVSQTNYKSQNSKMDNFVENKVKTQCSSALRKITQNNKIILLKRKQQTHYKSFIPKLRQKIKQGLTMRRFGYRKFQEVLRESKLNQV